jgi:hypothetical protein
MTNCFLNVLENRLGDPSLNASERRTVERAILAGRAREEVEKGKCALLAGDAEAAIGHFSVANVERKSWKLNLVLGLLHVAPASLRMLYQWRYRHLYKLATPGGRSAS